MRSFIGLLLLTSMASSIRSPAAEAGRLGPDDPAALDRIIAEGPPASSDAGGRYAFLVQKYGTFVAALADQQARTEDSQARQALFRKYWPLPNRFTPQFLAIAEQHPVDPAAFDCLAWIVLFGYSSSESRVAAELLAENHLGNPRLWDLTQEMSRDPVSEARAQVLRSLAARGQDPVRRGQATYALGTLLVKESDFVGTLKADLDPVQGESFDGATLARFRDLDPTRLASEAESCFDTVVRDYPDVPVAKLGSRPLRTFDIRDLPSGEDATGVAAERLGPRAEHDLRVIRATGVGRAAPEIVGRDADGREFRLSDYRGKTILLTFSGDWCPPCRDMYETERALVARMGGKPFVLLSVNTDARLETLQGSIAAGEITWRCWWERGGPTGDIPERWGVKSWPTMFVIDRSGSIRMRPVGVRPTIESASKLGRLIDSLNATDR